jgi:hypothetical protein
MAVFKNSTHHSAHPKPALSPKQLAVSQTQKRTPTSRRRRKNKALPLLPPPVVSRQGKTTIKRYSNRSFHRMEEVKGKTVEFVEFFTGDGYHVIDIGFEDKTALHLAIEPHFTLEREYADWKTGNHRSLKEWPLIRSQGTRG